MFCAVCVCVLCDVCMYLRGRFCGLFSLERMKVFLCVMFRHVCDVCLWMTCMYVCYVMYVYYVMHVFVFCDVWAYYRDILYIYTYTYIHKYTGAFCLCTCSFHDRKGETFVVVGTAENMSLAERGGMGALHCYTVVQNRLTLVHKTQVCMYVFVCVCVHCYTVVQNVLTLVHKTQACMHACMYACMYLCVCMHCYTVAHIVTLIHNVCSRPSPCKILRIHTHTLTHTHETAGRHPSRRSSFPRPSTCRMRKRSENI